MKKMLCLLVVVLMLTALFAVPASAVTCDRCSRNSYKCYYGPTTMQCVTDDVNQLSYTITGANACQCIKDTGSMIDVYHTVAVGSSSYTNEFHALRRDQYDTDPTHGSLVQKKWCKPGSAIPIESLSRNYRYNIKARGNTNHNMYDGLNTITINGWYRVNYR